MTKHAHDRCKCGHTRRMHDGMGCLSVHCWSPLKPPKSRRCGRFRIALKAKKT
jgi:hypothetical protein